MEISGPSGLWKDYDITAAPLNASALSEKVSNGVRVREYYFDGLLTADGKVRAFIRILENPESKGVLLYLPNNSQSETDEVPEKFLNFGYTVAVLDYAGKSNSSSRYTLYPRSLSNCNSREMEEFNAPNDALKSRWYIWTILARRAIHMLDVLYPDSVKFALGKGLGGCTVYKLSAFDDGLVACATLCNILPTIRGAGNNLINYRAALDNTAYASLCKVPLFMAVCSNDEDGMFDEMSELASNTESLENFRIVERAFSMAIRVVYKQCDTFFSSKKDGTPMPPVPVIEPTNSNNKLYFNINLDGFDRAPYSQVQFFCAFRIENPMHRNWTNVELVSMGSGKYLANVFVLDSDKPIYVFANVTDDNGTVMSSDLITVVPKTLGLKAQIPVSTRRRLIYDSGMGKDLWTAPRGGNLVVKSGPFGIDGISSDCFSLATFKPGDLLYKVDDDSLLQIIINGKPQTIKLSVIDENGKYSCDLQLTDPSDWTKFTLQPKNLMNDNKHLSSWKNSIIFILEGTDEFLVSSVVWV